MATEPRVPRVIVERADPVLVLKLENPAARNGITVEMADQLREALTRAASDDAIRAVVLTGAGGHFCSGADLSPMLASAQDLTPEGRSALVDGFLGGRLHPALLALWNFPKPTLGAMQGASVGFGLSLALACDLRVMARDAYLTSGFLSRGIFPDGGLTYQLQRLAGLGRTRELVFFPDLRLSSADALAWGLVTRVVEPDRLGAESLALAGTLARGPRDVQRAAKAALRESRPSFEEALAAELPRAKEAFAGEDVVEGMTAFFERRPPDFTRSKR
jgi:2-(1,2-epoxy-1,2-dihydrophenyl)acetyl-CoA isomerase